MPFVPGKDWPASSHAVGPGVADLEPGDRVLAALEYGAYAEARARAGGELLEAA